MTVECENLLAKYQFPREQWRDLEEALFYAKSTSQLEHFIKTHRLSVSKEPYTPADYKRISKCMFSGGKQINENFQKAYDIFDSVCEMTKYDLDKINEMSTSLPRARIALRISRVKNVSYVYKVWQDIAEEKVMNNLDKVFTALTPHTVKVVDFD